MCASSPAGSRDEFDRQRVELDAELDALRSRRRSSAYADGDGAGGHVLRGAVSVSYGVGIVGRVRRDAS